MRKTSEIKTKKKVQLHPDPSARIQDSRNIRCHSETRLDDADSFFFFLGKVLNFPNEFAMSRQTNAFVTKLQRVLLFTFFSISISRRSRIIILMSQ